MSHDVCEIVLKTQKLRWSSPSHFNDLCEFDNIPTISDNISDSYLRMIIDCAKGALIFNYTQFNELTSARIYSALDMMRRGLTDVEVFEYLSASVNKVDSQFIAEMTNKLIGEKYIDQYRVICFTVKYDNNLMWAHYADNHKGCVLEFTDYWSELDCKVYSYPIDYSHEPFFLERSIESIIYGDSNKETRDWGRAALFSKSKEWKYESEFRSLFFSGEEPSTVTDVPFKSRSLKSITFGARFDAARINEIIQLARTINSSCEFYQMKKGKPLTRFELSR